MRKADIRVVWAVWIVVSVSLAGCTRQAVPERSKLIEHSSQNSVLIPVVVPEGAKGISGWRGIVRSESSVRVYLVRKELVSRASDPIPMYVQSSQGTRPNSLAASILGDRDTRLALYVPPGESEHLFPIGTAISVDGQVPVVLMHGVGSWYVDFQWVRESFDPIMVRYFEASETIPGDLPARVEADAKVAPSCNVIATNVVNEVQPDSISAGRQLAPAIDRSLAMVGTSDIAARVRPGAMQRWELQQLAPGIQFGTVCSYKQHESGPSHTMRGVCGVLVYCRYAGRGTGSATVQ